MATKISQLHGGLIQYIMVDLTDGLERWRSMLVVFSSTASHRRIYVRHLNQQLPPAFPRLFLRRYVIRTDICAKSFNVVHHGDGMKVNV